ncbi:hypothetical protein FJZ27_00765 [Candidatus Peribacteria bacterium]|nr:hypothetical protein [Candidatus Peribacteria bacterium]
MVPIPHDDNGIPDLTNREILKELLQEIAAVRTELKEDIASLDTKLSCRMDKMDAKMSSVERRLDQRIGNLEVKVDRNFLCFMSNLESIDRRVVVLESR